MRLSKFLSAPSASVQAHSTKRSNQWQRASPPSPPPSPECHPIQDPHLASANYQDRDIVFADTPETFALSVINLLHQPELRQKIGTASIWHSQRYANDLVKAEHDWESIVAKLERIYLEIVSSES